MKLLVSTICFINFSKPGAEIYATFANRLIDDTMTKTPWDIRVATNAPAMFQDAIAKYGDRVSLLVDDLTDNRVAVGAFNQLLKYFAFSNVPSDYDWVLYLDCDAGFRSHGWDGTPGINEQLVINHIQNWNSLGYDALGVRTNAIVRGELLDHERCLADLEQQTRDGVENPYSPMNLFSCKFSFYNLDSKTIDPDWLDASMPSEHFLLLQNNIPGRMQKVSDKIAEFNKILIAQEGGHVTISDMEAFEIGVAVKVAGYTMGDAGDFGHNWVMLVNFNGSNWEGVKL